MPCSKWSIKEELIRGTVIFVVHTPKGGKTEIENGIPDCTFFLDDKDPMTCDFYKEDKYIFTVSGTQKL